MNQAAQKEPDVDQETWVGNSVLPLTSRVTLGRSPKFPRLRTFNCEIPTPSAGHSARKGQVSTNLL